MHSVQNKLHRDVNKATEEWGRGRGRGQGQRYRVSYKDTIYERLHSNTKFINTNKSHPAWQWQQCQCTIQQLASMEYYNWSKQQVPIREERNVNDVISMTNNEATRSTFVRTRPALHEAEDEAGCYEAEAENFGLEATLAFDRLRTRLSLRMPRTPEQNSKQYARNVRLPLAAYCSWEYISSSGLNCKSQPIRPNEIINWHNLVQCKYIQNSLLLQSSCYRLCNNFHF